MTPITTSFKKPDEIDQILRAVSSVTCRKNVLEEAIEATKEAAVSLLVAKYGLSLDDAKGRVATAAAMSTGGESSQHKGLGNGNENF